MRLFIVRHGQTAWNLHQKFQGQVNIPLDQTGLEQTKVLAQAIKDIPLDAVYTSPLNRCAKMAEMIYGDRYEIIREPLLLEMAFGIYEGESYADKNAYPLDHPFHNYFHDRANYVPPEGAESFQDIIKRVKAFLEKMSRLHPQQQIVAFSHGAFIRTLISVLHGLENFVDKHVSTPNNCSVTVITDNQNGYLIEQEAVDILNGEKLRI